MRFIFKSQSRVAVIAILSALTLLAQGCATAEEDEAQLLDEVDQADQAQMAEETDQEVSQAVPGSVIDERLTLREATAQRIAGSYSRDGATLNFVAEKRQDSASLVLTGAAGQPLFESRRGADASGVSVSIDALGGRLVTQGTDKEELAAQMATEMATDPTAPADLFSHADLRALPWLSRALGAEGITGRDYPASLPLHLLAEVVAQATDTDVPPLPVDELQSNAATPPAEYETLCQDLSGDPNNNDCFGMCGRGCSCWSWVCGDCCWHEGCDYHDQQCRRCAWNRPHACYLCVNAHIAFPIGGGC